MRESGTHAIVRYGASGAVVDSASNIRAVATARVGVDPSGVRIVRGLIVVDERPLDGLDSADAGRRVVRAVRRVEGGHDRDGRTRRGVLRRVARGSVRDERLLGRADALFLRRLLAGVRAARDDGQQREGERRQTIESIHLASLRTHVSRPAHLQGRRASDSPTRQPRGSGPTGVSACNVRGASDGARVPRPRRARRRRRTRGTATAARRGPRSAGSWSRFVTGGRARGLLPIRGTSARLLAA
jgi:hypothetical protein